MKIKSMRSSKRVALYAVVTILLLCGVAGAVFALGSNRIPTTTNATTSPNKTQNTIDYDAPTDSQVKDGQSTKLKNITGSDTSNNDQATLGTVTITAAQEDSDNTVLQVRSYIATVDSSLQCDMTLKKDGTVLNLTSSVQTSANVTTCTGFTVPVSQLSEGVWQVTMTYSKQSVSSSASTTVEIKV